MLDTDTVLPFRATLARSVEQTITVLVAVGLHVSRDACLSPTALCRSQPDWRTGAVEARRVTSIPHAVLSDDRGWPAADVPAWHVLLGEVQQVAVHSAITVHVGPGTEVRVDRSLGRVGVGVDAGDPRTR